MMADYTEVIQERQEYIPEVGGNKPRFSRWLITLNSNKRGHALNSPVVGFLQEVLRCAFSNRANRSRIFEYTKNDRPGRPPAPDANRNPATLADVGYPIRHVTLTMGHGEVGETGRLHIHALVDVLHYSWIRINNDREHGFRGVIEECRRMLGGEARFGITRLYASAKWVPSSKIYEYYISKGTLNVQDVNIPQYARILERELPKRGPAGAIKPAVPAHHVDVAGLPEPDIGGPEFEAPVRGRRGRGPAKPAAAVVPPAPAVPKAMVPKGTAAIPLRFNTGEIRRPTTRTTSGYKTISARVHRGKK